MFANKDRSSVRKNDNMPSDDTSMPPRLALTIRAAAAVTTAVTDAVANARPSAGISTPAKWQATRSRIDNTYSSANTNGARNTAKMAKSIASTEWFRSQLRQPMDSLDDGDAAHNQQHEHRGHQ